MQLMLSSGTLALDAVDASGRTPLHLACRGGWPRIIELLVAAGADTTKLTADGDTPAELCVSKAAFDALTLTPPGKAGIAPIGPSPLVAPAAPAKPAPPASYPVREVAGAAVAAGGKPMLVPTPPASARPNAINNPARTGRSFQISEKRSASLDGGRGGVGA